jgi:hypothetical protein
MLLDFSRKLELLEENLSKYYLLLSFLLGLVFTTFSATGKVFRKGKKTVPKLEPCISTSYSLFCLQLRFSKKTGKDDNNDSTKKSLRRQPALYRRSVSQGSFL